VTTLLNDRARLKLKVSEERKARVPKAKARLCDVPWEEPPPNPPRRRGPQYGKAKKRRRTPQPSYLIVREAPKHPSFSRVVGACCPFSGLSRAELEQHVAGILAMVDEADRRKGRAA
jgi:hypothetical protein